MPKIHYVICKMLPWDDFVITANGVDYEMSQPEGEPVVGFIPVYDDREVAVAESNGLDIVALMIGPTGGEFVKEEGDPNAKTEDG